MITATVIIQETSATSASLVITCIPMSMEIINVVHVMTPITLPVLALDQYAHNLMTLTTLMIRISVLNVLQDNTVIPVGP